MILDFKSDIQMKELYKWCKVRPPRTVTGIATCAETVFLLADVFDSELVDMALGTHSLLREAAVTHTVPDGW